MVAFMLESLVLRGVAVLRGELSVGLRLGTSAEANMRSSGVRNSRRHPSPGCRKPDLQPTVGPDVDYSTKGVTPGAGRSRRQFGARLLSGAARTTCRLATSWLPTFGGSTSVVAATRRAIPAGLAAAASEGRRLQLAVRQTEDLRTEHVSARELLALPSAPPCWRKPAGRTPPIGKRETEGR